MGTVKRTLESYGVEPVWNGETSQYYAQWTLDDGIECRIWIEDETSLAMKADLVHKYGLGGIAAWVLGNERSTVWEVLTRSMAGDASAVVAEQRQLMETQQEEAAQAGQEEVAQTEQEAAAQTQEEAAAQEEQNAAAQAGQDEAAQARQDAEAGTEAAGGEES